MKGRRQQPPSFFWGIQTSTIRKHTDLEWSYAKQIDLIFFDVWRTMHLR